MGLWDWLIVKPKKKIHVPPHRKYALPVKKFYARALRRHSTDTEKLLWAELRKKKLGCKFHRQSVMFGWIADFWCPSKMLIVEVDGGYHNEKRQMEWDKHRDEVLQQRGIKTIRFKNWEITNNMPKVIEKIEEILRKK